MRATVFWLLVGVGRTVIGSAASSTKDLTGYWSVEIPTKSGGPSALICLKFRSVTSHSAAFHEVRKLSWSEPYEKSVT